MYAVAFQPDGNVLAAAGSDGKVRLINPENGSLVKEFAPVTVKARSVAQNTTDGSFLPSRMKPLKPRRFRVTRALCHWRFSPRKFG